MLGSVVPSSGRVLCNSFRSVVIELLDDDGGVSSSLMDWKKHNSVAIADGFEIKRRTDKDLQLRITMHLDYQPARYKLSQPLSSLLRTHLILHAKHTYNANNNNTTSNHHNNVSLPLVDTQSNVCALLYEYIRSKGLQSETDPTVVTCDPELQHVTQVQITTLLATALCSLTSSYIDIFNSVWMQSCHHFGTHSSICGAFICLRILFAIWFGCVQ